MSCNLKVIYLFQYSKAKENGPPVLLTRPSVPASRPRSFRQKARANRTKSANSTNTRNKRANGPKRKGGSRRRRRRCPPHRGLCVCYSLLWRLQTDDPFILLRFVSSQKLSKPREERRPGGGEGAEREKRKAPRPARGDPTRAREPLPAAAGHAVSRRQDGDVSGGSNARHFILWSES